MALNLLKSSVAGRRLGAWQEEGMALKATAAELIMEALAVAQGIGCTLEQLIGACPGFTWNEIFLEVDRLSRAGHVQLSQDKPGVYRIRLPKPPSSTSTPMGGRGARSI
jgi:hypothetical protein